jgi:hypothetical protein
MFVCSLIYQFVLFSDCMQPGCDLASNRLQSPITYVHCFSYMICVILCYMAVLLPSSSTRGVFADTGEGYIFTLNITVRCYSVPNCQLRIPFLWLL